ncbi:hypothetical protein PTW37_17705 (plasmid) [Arthrobacter agilis]|uniref:hypothetical protein n=1 Tax=Arthrobacter agilis TaxID=37921 RepID=UPI002366F4FA|nr:hypothetical protein [Arthrobacter agilis]WDF35236.1 hypothetical protein PTW37_17705 [Arthrobacter agilis]
MSAAESIGAIYTMPTGASRNAVLRTTIEAHRKIASNASTVLVDANRYHGKNRIRASAPLNIDWLQRQWDAGLSWAITDSGYLERDAEHDLRSLFASAQELERQATGSFFLSVPADSHWVSFRAAELRKIVEEHGIPVIYLFGATGDPLATKRAVQGLLHLLDSPVPSALMRTDQAAIGALAGSAVFGAMGISTSLRHIYPPDKRGFSPSPFPSAFLPQGLSYHRIDTLAQAIALSPEELHWSCHCERCQGMRLDSIFDDTAAFTHSIHSLADATRHVLTGGGSAASLIAWASKCQTAQFTHFDIAATTGMRWDPPSFLGAWVASG